MDPAFSSPRQAAGFAALLLFVLLLPVIARKGILPVREQMYSAAGRETIDFPNLHQQIFEETSDIDIAVMGSSRLGCAIDARFLAARLSEKLGRPAVVCPLTWTWNGYDALYFIAKDLLEHRKVHTMVISDLTYDLSPAAGSMAHHQTSYWFRYADDAVALAGLAPNSKASFYASAILGLPRNLVGALRSNLAAVPSGRTAIPWNQSATDYSPRTLTDSGDVRTYSDSTKASFHLSNAPIAAMQSEFVRRIGLLAHEHRMKLVFLAIPDFADRGDALIEEMENWPVMFHAEVSLVGVPPAKLFAGMTDDEIRKLYFNPTHFNQNGQSYFTRLVTPSLIENYENQP